VASNIPILKFPDGTTRENATYNGEIIKQADVNLLANPLKYYTDPVQVKKDLDYYEPRSRPMDLPWERDSDRRRCARAGDAERAYDLWVKSYKFNEVPPFGVLSAVRRRNKPHSATGAGGSLQATLMGFGGNGHHAER
jgi:trehalose/maltose hydrolase-like predicted phosphorylase